MLKLRLHGAAASTFDIEPLHHHNQSFQFNPYLQATNTMAGFINRENRVPHYQQLFQQGGKQHVRQWNQTPKSKYMLTPYYILLGGTFGGAMYMMVRMVLGHKTWFSKG
ncbi:hypothetical protein G7Y89_g3850 [Cudoniella acicularis]|uniref:Uncharacterized protein n=1 Tax=Cudoniella acicularis TaxID=354080 RepID=A0A8H4RTK4_9HELO|nr:hypothetical protein G7Y89_g3850 [Cudoniella acicularis]